MFRAALTKLLPKPGLNTTGTAVKCARAAAVNGLLRPAPSLLSSSTVRLYGATQISKANPVSLQMIDYALGLARFQKSDESYAQALLVLEQGLSSRSQEEADGTIENSKGMILLAMSSLLSERGNTDEAIQTLMRIHDLTSSSIGVRVAAMEALVGLHLELGLDDTSSVLADKCLNLLEKEGLQIDDDFGYRAYSARSMAVKGLVELVHGNFDTAKKYFDGCQDEGCNGNTALSYGEFLHTKRDFSAAKELYQKAISDSSEKKDFYDPYFLGACNMISEEILLAATCALGQLESHLGNFADAEEILTGALKKAEEIFGMHHPKVGTVLTCVALMYRQKATAEHSSSLLIQEGLYRKAIDLLKAPALQTDDMDGFIEKLTENIERRDIVALARGGYGEALGIQENRKSEGEKMKRWAECAWRNRRLSLSEALDISNSSSKVPVVDARICRVL